MISSVNSNGGSGNRIQNNGVIKPSNHAPVRKQQTAQALPNADEKTLSMKQDLPTRQEPPLSQTKTQKPLNADGNTLLMRQTSPHKLANTGENAVLKRQGVPARQEPALSQTNLQKPHGPRSQLNTPRVLVKLQPSGIEYEPRRLFEETPRKKPCVEMGPRTTQDPVTIERKPPFDVATKPPVDVARKPPSGHVNNVSLYLMLLTDLQAVMILS